MVVDNSSTDGSREYLEAKFPGVIFKWNETNAGFASANNSVCNMVKGEFILFLNPDTILAEDCFEKCLGFLRMREACGALGVRMIDGSGKFLKESKRGFPGPAASFYKMSGLAAMFPASKTFSGYYAGHLPEKDIREVDVLAGAFLMLRKKVLDITGGFDENFFMYGEDIDLSYRVQKAGFKNYYFPTVTIVHFKGESTQKGTKLHIDRFYGAMRLFVKKHYSGNGITRIFMLLAIAVSKVLSQGKIFCRNIFTGNSVQNSGNRDTLVVASHAYFNELIQLIKFAKDPVVIQGRVSATSHDKEASVGAVDDLPRIVVKNKSGKIIFCEESLSFKDMIGLMEQLKGKIEFLFHANKSESIVGSSDKNEKGVFIAKE